MVIANKDTMKEYHFEEDYNDILNTFWGVQIEREYLELPYDIWIDYRGIDCSRTFRVPLVRVYLEELEKLVPVSIGEAPTVLMDKQFEHSELVLDWVKKNSEKLLRIWNHDYPDLAEEGEAKMSFVRHV